MTYIFPRHPQQQRHHQPQSTPATHLSPPHRASLSLPANTPFPPPAIAVVEPDASRGRRAHPAPVQARTLSAPVADLVIMRKETCDGHCGETGAEEAVWPVRGGGFDDHGHGTTKVVAAGDLPCVSCTTFNILAPIYKRLDKEDQSRRESQHRAYWLARNQSILDRLLSERSSIICLQEVWVGNEEFVEMYDKRLGDAGYATFKLARTNNRGDGLLTALRRDYFEVLNYREMLFNDFGDRVAQLLHVESIFPTPRCLDGNMRQQIIIVNTHLLFPHDYSYCIVRLRQVYMILEFVESYQKEQNLGPVPIMLCGDWNGSKRGHVYKLLRSQGFESSYDTAHQYTDSDVDAHKWVSHRNHRGNVCGVDFIWLLNPEKNRKPLRTSWNEALYGIIKKILLRASLSEENAFAFLRSDNDSEHITFSSFCQSLFQIGMSGPNGLTTEDVTHLWSQADVDGDGVINPSDFQKSIWNPVVMDDMDQSMAKKRTDTVDKSAEDVAIGLDVRAAALFPPEVERGMWPDNYSLSDHAPLTVVFSPRMAAPGPIC